MVRRVWNSPRVELSMKDWRLEQTEDRERGSPSSRGNNEKIEHI